MPGFIDAHVHIWPGGGKTEPFTAEHLFRHAKPAGVSGIVLIQPGSSRFDNSYMLEAVRRHPGVFSAVAIVDAEAPDVAAQMRQMKMQGVRGFRITPGKSPQTWLDTAGMERMWRAGAELRMAMCPLVNPDALESIGRMSARHPETPVAIDHLARIGADGTIRDADLRLLCGLAKHRQVNVKVSAFYALGKKQPPYTDLAPMIRMVFENFGPRRLMWATDSPYQTQGIHTYLASVELIRDRLPFLSKDDRQWMLAGTAERVFFSP